MTTAKINLLESLSGFSRSDVKCIRGQIRVLILLWDYNSLIPFKKISSGSKTGEYRKSVRFNSHRIRFTFSFLSTAPDFPCFFDMVFGRKETPGGGSFFLRLPIFVRTTVWLDVGRWVGSIGRVAILPCAFPTVKWSILCVYTRPVEVVEGEEWKGVAHFCRFHVFI